MKKTLSVRKNTMNIRSFLVSFCLLLINQNQQISAAALDENKSLEYFSTMRDAMAVTSGFLDQTSVSRLFQVSKRLNEEALTAPLIKFSFEAKFNPLPSNFRYSKMDILWFNKFAPEQVKEEAFWFTVLRACDTGADLKSCAAYANDLAQSIIDTPEYFDVPELIKHNLLLIIDQLIKSKNHGKLIDLLKLQNFSIDTEMKSCFEN